MLPWGPGMSKLEHSSWRYMQSWPFWDMWDSLKRLSLILLANLVPTHLLYRGCDVLSRFTSGTEELVSPAAGNTASTWSWLKRLDILRYSLYPVTFYWWNLRTVSSHCSMGQLWRTLALPKEATSALSRNTSWPKFSLWPILLLSFLSCWCQDNSKRCPCTLIFISEYKIV